MKMDKRITTKVVPVIFVLVGMMFIGPAITEKAQATISAKAFSTFYRFSKVIGVILPFEGIFAIPPTLVPGGHEIFWGTTGTFSFGNEFGFVKADVGGHTVDFYFHNPPVGPNNCFVVPPELGNCHITQGVHATAQYVITLRPPPGAHSGDTNSDDEDDGSGNAP
jgi:hypothetical protein